MARRLNEWRGRNLSVLGKVLVSKAQGMSQLVFIATMTAVPEWVVKQANKLIYGFIWGGPDKITRQLAWTNYDKGGLRAPNLKALIDALQATWISRYCRPGEHGWKIFMELELKKAGCDIYCLTGKLATKSKLDQNKILPHAIKVWGEVSGSANNITQILESSLWMNADISSTKGKPNPLDKRSNYLHRVKDLLNDDLKLATFEELKIKGLPHGEYLCRDFHICHKRHFFKIEIITFLESPNYALYFILINVF